MKKFFLFITIIMLSYKLFSQSNKNISLELRYPIPIGHNFVNGNLNNGYNGIADIGINYSLLKSKNFALGLLFNSSLLRLSITDVNLLILSPKIKIDYKININKINIIPSFALGYSNWRFTSNSFPMIDASGNVIQGKKYKNNINGITFNGSTKIVSNTSNRLNWGISIAYEYTKLEKPTNGAINSNFNRNISILYPGFVIIWDFKKNNS